MAILCVLAICFNELGRWQQRKADEARRESFLREASEVVRLKKKFEEQDRR
jgi:hypothetical protein